MLTPCLAACGQRQARVRLFVRRYAPVDFSGAYDGYGDSTRKPLINEENVPTLAAPRGTS